MILDLDAIEAKANDVRHVSFPSGDVILALVAEVRRLTEESARWRTEALGHAENVRGVTELAHRWRLRAEAAEVPE